MILFLSAGSEVSMDVRRHGFESSSRRPKPVSVSIVSQFASIQANISLDSDHKGTRITLWKTGRTQFLCPGTSAACKSHGFILVFPGHVTCEALQWDPATAFL